ncbi:unnamed protein product [Boreogadus saida]
MGCVFLLLMEIIITPTCETPKNTKKHGERQSEGTDASRKRDSRSSAGRHRSEDSSDSREDDGNVSQNPMRKSMAEEGEQKHV